MKPVVVIVGQTAYAMVGGALCACEFQGGRLDMAGGEPAWAQVANFGEEPEIQAEIDLARAMLKAGGAE